MTTVFYFDFPFTDMNSEKPPREHPQALRINEALNKLQQVLDHWCEDDIDVYPSRLPSFDELLSDIKDKLHSITWRMPNHCKTCGSEIVETVNDSVFRDGDCGPCEYQRYRSQHDLLLACTILEGLLWNIATDKRRAVALRRIEGLEARELAERVSNAIAKAHGNAK